MFYNFSDTVPAGTKEEDERYIRMPICKGVVHQVRIISHPGSNGVLYCRIKSGLHQAWPTNPQENFRLSGVTIDWKDFFEIEDKPYELTLHTWNLSTRFEHEIIVQLGVLPMWIVAPAGLPSKVVEGFKRMFGIGGD